MCTWCRIITVVARIPMIAKRYAITAAITMVPTTGFVMTINGIVAITVMGLL
jgi:hypothetical protein